MQWSFGGSFSHLALRATAAELSNISAQAKSVERMFDTSCGFMLTEVASTGNRVPSRQVWCLSLLGEPLTATLNPIDSRTSYFAECTHLCPTQLPAPSPLLSEKETVEMDQFSASQLHWLAFETLKAALVQCCLVDLQLHVGISSLSAGFLRVPGCCLQQKRQGTVPKSACWIFFFASSISFLSLV